MKTAWFASGYSAQAHLCETNDKNQARVLCGANPKRLTYATGNKRCPKCKKIEGEIKRQEKLDAAIARLRDPSGDGSTILAIRGFGEKLAKCTRCGYPVLDKDDPSRGSIAECKCLGDRPVATFETKRGPSASEPR